MPASSPYAPPWGTEANSGRREMLGYMPECGLKFPPLSALETIGAELMPSS